MGLTGGPHLSAGGRERRRGRWWSGPRGPEVGSWAAAERKGEGEESGPRAGWGGKGRKVRFVFSFFFKSFLKPTFKPFQIQIYTQLFSKLFTNLFTIILKDFSQILLKTFKITPQPKTKTTKIKATHIHLFNLI
jgi:hypothetical protein